MDTDDIKKLRECTRIAAGVLLVSFGSGAAFIAAAPVITFIAADVISGGRLERIMPNLVRSALGALPTMGLMIVGLGIDMIDPDIDTLE